MTRACRNQFERAIAAGGGGGPCAAFESRVLQPCFSRISFFHWFSCELRLSACAMQPTLCSREHVARSAEAANTTSTAAHGSPSASAVSATPPSSAVEHDMDMEQRLDALMQLEQARARPCELPHQPLRCRCFLLRNADAPFAAAGLQADRVTRHVQVQPHSKAVLLRRCAAVGDM